MRLEKTQKCTGKNDCVTKRPVKAEKSEKEKNFDKLLDTTCKEFHPFIEKTSGLLVDTQTHQEAVWKS